MKNQVKSVDGYIALPYLGTAVILGIAQNEKKPGVSPGFYI
jgi:hypothetical protein